MTSLNHHHNNHPSNHRNSHQRNHRSNNTQAQLDKVSHTAKVNSRAAIVVETEVDVVDHVVEVEADVEVDVEADQEDVVGEDVEVAQGATMSITVTTTL